MAEEVVREVLHGQLHRPLRPPTRQVQVFVASTGEDFTHELRHLKAVTFPALQNHFLERNINFHLIDPFDDVENGFSSLSSGPQLQMQQCRQIEDCERLSCGTFFLCLVGSRSAPVVVPSTIVSSDFSRLLDMAAKQDSTSYSLLKEWYQSDEQSVPPRFILTSPASCSTVNDENNQGTSNGFRQLQECLCQLFSNSSREELSSLNPSVCSTVVESCFRRALSTSENSTRRIIGVVRTFNDHESTNDREFQNHLLKTFKEQMVEVLTPPASLLQFSVPWNQDGINPLIPEHESYLCAFGEKVSSLLKQQCEQYCSEEAAFDDLGLLVRETFIESRIHLVHCQKVLKESCSLAIPALEQVQNLITKTAEDNLTPGPIVVIGGDCSGKTSLLSNVAANIGTWLKQPDTTICILRYVGHSPRSMYAAELVRSLCFQITLTYGFEVLTHHQNYEGSRLCSWFDDLIHAAEGRDSPLVLLVDDLHVLKISPPQSQPNQQLANQNHQEQSADSTNLSGILSWLPWNLPKNVYVVCTMGTGAASGATTMSCASNLERVLGAWKKKLAVDGRLVAIEPLSPLSLSKLINHTLLTNYGYLPSTQCIHEILTNCSKYANNLLACRLLIYDKMQNFLAQKNEDSANSTVPLSVLTGSFLERLENKHGTRLISLLSRYFTCTRFGLTDVELWDLLNGMNRRDSDEGAETKLKSVNVFLAARVAMSLLLMERISEGSILFAWRHRCLIEINKQRYFVTQKAKRATHGEIAYLFLIGFYSNKGEELSPTVDLSVIGGNTPNSLHHVSSQSQWLWTNVRPIEELWFHLLHTGDVSRIKQATVCNLRFLQLAVQNCSVCYVISILELVRTQILDMEIELVYHTLRLATDVLSKDPLQTACEIISWLRPFADSSLENIEALISQAMEWCDMNVTPQIVPLTSWLWTPVPQQASVLSMPLGVDMIAVTHDSQYVICTTRQKVIQMFHVASRQLIRTFTGHHGRVVCVHVEKSGQYLISGSEDTTVIAWDLVAASPYRIISEHFATVTCVTTTQSDTLVISGSDDSRVIIVQLATGAVVQKLEHHRGAITCLAITDTDEVLVTGSTDSSVCVWSLENYNLLNTITLVSPVLQMDLSCDSTFLLIVCDNNNLYLHSLTTGSEIHAISGRDSAIGPVQIGSDNCRAVVGCENSTALVYDIHTTKLLYTFKFHEYPVTGIKISQDGSFLFTAGGDKVVVSYFDRIRPQHEGKIFKTQANNRKVSVSGHSDHITCLAISKDGSLAISGSKDHLVKVWQLNLNELHNTLEGHTGSITCVAFAPSNLYAVSGSEDKTVRVWGLTLGLIVFEFKEHQAKITALKVLSDSRRILSADAMGMLKLWQAESGMVLLSCLGPTGFIDVTNSMRFAICGVGDNSLHIWTVSHEDQKYTVNHSDSILCYALSHDSKYVITGSSDTSLKIWDITSGKLTQVLVGHTGSVTCVTVAVYNHALVFSGSEDCHVIIWDRLTGNELHNLTGHLASVTTVAVTVDGKTLVSGSRDMTVRVWNSNTGETLSLLDMHVPVLKIMISFDASHIVVMLENCKQLPLLCLHNHPVVNIEETVAMTTEERIDGSWSDVIPRKAPHRLLHKEMSLDTYTWQKKYGGTPTKRSSTISLEDFQAMAASVVANWDKVNKSSTASSQSSSISDIHSIQSSDSVPPHFATVASAAVTQEAATILSALHSTLGREECNKEMATAVGRESKEPNLDVAPWEAESFQQRQGPKEFPRRKPNSKIENSAVCIVM